MAEDDECALSNSKYSISRIPSCTVTSVGALFKDLFHLDSVKEEGGKGKLATALTKNDRPFYAVIVLTLVFSCFALAFLLTKKRSPPFPYHGAMHGRGMRAGEHRRGGHEMQGGMRGRAAHDMQGGTRRFDDGGERWERRLHEEGEWGKGGQPPHSQRAPRHDRPPPHYPCYPCMPPCGGGKKWKLVDED